MFCFGDLNRYCRVNRQAGAGLIEVAIAILVLSVGTLGLAKLQIAAKRLGFEALQRTEAAAMAADLLERMRANHLVLSSYQTPGLGAATGEPLPTPEQDCSLVRCSSAQLNRWDLWQWEQLLNGAATVNSADEPVGGLVNPTGCVTVSGRQVTVEIAWRGFLSMPSPVLPDSCGAGGYGPDDTSRQALRMSSWIVEGWSE